jgi:hypothetical protein
VEVKRETPAPTKEEQMAKYLLSTHTVEGEAREPMTDDEMQGFMRKIGELEEEMQSAGALVYSGRLDGPETATVVSVTNGKPMNTDGPFAETKEHLAGFYIVDAADLDEALAWATKTSVCIGKPIEVRPFAGLRGA